jgi:TPR repeat protein
MLELATFYNQIRPFSADIKKNVVTLLKLSAEMGHPCSQYRMYLLFRNDPFSVGYTPRYAYSMVRQSMLGGYEASIHSVASCYREGLGVEQDWKMALCLHFISLSRRKASILVEKDLKVNNESVV